MSSSNEVELQETIRSVFRGKPVERVELFGSAARGGMNQRSDLDISSHQARRPRAVIFLSWPQN
jgi:predicted nucleotidyltransferase